MIDWRHIARLAALLAGMSLLSSCDDSTDKTAKVETEVVVEETAAVEATEAVEVTTESANDEAVEETVEK